MPFKNPANIEAIIKLLLRVVAMMRRIKHTETAICLTWASGAIVIIDVNAVPAISDLT